RTRRRLAIAASLLAAVGAMAGSAAYFTHVRHHVTAAPPPVAVLPEAPAPQSAPAEPPAPEVVTTPAVAAQKPVLKPALSARAESKPPRKLAPLRITSTERPVSVETAPEIRQSPEPQAQVGLPADSPPAAPPDAAADAVPTPAA